ncbi:MAG: AarF/UbiB family protein [Bdellovibrionota bacterium]|nr:AarF/UbiB family protein [Bdellovibrionota bacterium]
MVLKLLLFLSFIVAYQGYSYADEEVVDVLEAAKLDEKAEKYYLPESLRIFSKYMLLVYDGSDSEKIKAFDTALESLIGYYKSDAEVVEVKSLEDYLAHRYLDRELYIDLQAEVRHLTNGKAYYKFYYQPNSSAVSKQIAQYHENQFEFAQERFSEVLEKHSGSSSSSFSGAERYRRQIFDKFMSWELLTENSDREALGYLHVIKSTISNQQKLQIVNAFSNAFKKMDEELRSVGEKVAADKEKFQVDMVEVKGVGRFIQLLLGGVFENLTSIGSKNMISGLLDNPDQRNSFQKFRTVLSYGVPQLLKFLQLVARMDGIDDKIKEVFASLESGGKAAPLALVLEELEKEKESLARQNLKIIEVERAFHAGSIAQMHTVRVMDTKTGKVHDWAMRMVKPGMEDMIPRGTVNISNTAKVIDQDPELRKVNWPLMGPSVGPMDKDIYRDIDSKGASERQVMAESEYTHSIQLNVPSNHRLNLGITKLFPKNQLDLEIRYYVPKMYYYSDPNENGVRIQLMEKVKGQKIAKLSESGDENDKILAKEITRGLIHRWMETGFIKSGFIHADLHLGNFMVDTIEKVSGTSARWFSLRKTKTEKVVVDVPIIDFGMGGVIDKAFRSHFISLVLASKFRDATGMKEILWSLSIVDQSPVSKKDFDKAFDEKYLEESKIKNSEERMRAKDWVVFAINQGLVLPDQFVSLSRGTGILLTLAVKYEIAKRLMGMMRSTMLNNKSLSITVFKNGLVDWKMIRGILGRKIVGNSCRSSSAKE